MEVKFDIENPLTNSNTNTLSDLLLLESDHKVSPIYLQRLQSLGFSLSFRRDTISLISQFCGSFDPFLSYLAVNYLDRFFSNQGIPLQTKPWVVRLLGITCVSLAAKMMKTEFNLSVFQCEGLIFDSQTIERMEMLMLGALKWRMRSITPFAFLQFFATFFKMKDPPLMQALKDRALEIIFKAQNEIKVLEFKPSIVAASSLLCAANELFPIQFPSFLVSIRGCSYVDKEKLEGCINVIEGIVMDGYATSLFDHDDGDEDHEDHDRVKCNSISVVSSSSMPVNVQWSNSSDISNDHKNIISITQTNTRKFTASDSETVQHHPTNDLQERENNKIGSSSSSMSTSSNLTIQLSQLQQC